MMDIGSAKLGINVAEDVPQEQEDHHDHQRDGQKQRELHIRDGIANGFRRVVQSLHLNRRRNDRTKLRKELLDGVHHFHGVRAGLAFDGQDHGFRVVPPIRDAIVLHAVVNLARHLPAAPASHCDKQ